jgi:Fic family protein
MNGFDHIAFRKQWELTEESAYMLGECEAMVEVLAGIPLMPEDRKQLLTLSLIKGAQATTAIEGNTLTQSEIEKIHEGWRLPPSKEYLQTEVNNILDAFNTLLREIVVENKVEAITPELIKKCHQMIGKDLGEHFDAIPGRFRTDRRVVGRYLAPEPDDVPELINHLCAWLAQEFHYKVGQNFKTAVIEAIVAHVYIEWIHPFGDGNGRTGRLIEFYILLRAGLPNIGSHILSNFYNITRPHYYRHLDDARRKRDLTDFIHYAVQGFRDGLKETLGIIQTSQFMVFWRHYIYEVFADVNYRKSNVFKRKRNLMLNIPIDQFFLAEELLEINPSVAKEYAVVGKATYVRDLKELQALQLIRKEGRNYIANTTLLKQMLPDKKPTVG